MMQPQSTLFRGPNEHVGPLKKDQCALTPKICPLRKALRWGEVEQVARPRASQVRVEVSAAVDEGLDALGVAHERRHDEDADDEEHGLQQIDSVNAEIEQAGHRPAAGEGSTEHFRADQNGGA